MSKAKKDYNELSVFPERLYLTRMSLGITQNFLAKRCGVTRQTISDYEAGKTSPDIISLGKIAEYFNVSTDYLLGLTDCRNPNNPKLVARCGELEERLLLLEAKSRTFDKLLSSIRDISLEYVSELGIDFLLQREVENG